MIRQQHFLLALLLTLTPQHVLGGPDAATNRTGLFSITMTSEQLLGNVSSQYQHVLASDEDITWQAYVPEHYSADSPPGVLVYISPSQSGSLPQGWASVMEDHNLIWIGANQSGNRVLASRRILKAVLALEAVRQQYAIDKTRLYVAGFSGGGKVASMIASDLATTFAGGIFICGVLSWEQDDETHAEAIRSNRYVFLTGERDQALVSTKQAFRSYRDAGVTNVELVIVRGMGHSNPPRKEISQAIDFLDQGANAMQ